MFHVLDRVEQQDKVLTMNDLDVFTMAFANVDIEKCREYAKKTGRKCYIVRIEEEA